MQYGWRCVANEHPDLALVKQMPGKLYG